MSSLIRFKFKSNVNYDAISFDGSALSVRDLKNAIRNKCGLRGTDYDLRLQHEDGKVYGDEDELVQNFSQVLVVRAPRHNTDAGAITKKKLAEVNNSTSVTPLSDPETTEPVKIVNQSTDNAYMTKDGRYVVPKLDAGAYAEGKKEKRPFSNEENPKNVVVSSSEPSSQQDSLLERVFEKIPGEMMCPLCHRIMKDPQVIVCCGMSFCKECIVSSLFKEDSDYFHCCPSCKTETMDVDSLVPNKNISEAVAKFLDRQEKMAVLNVNLNPLSRNSSVGVFNTTFDSVQSPAVVASPGTPEGTLDVPKEGTPSLSPKPEFTATPEVSQHLPSPAACSSPPCPLPPPPPTSLPTVIVPPSYPAIQAFPYPVPPFPPVFQQYSTTFAGAPLVTSEAPGAILPPGALTEQEFNLIKKQLLRSEQGDRVRIEPRVPASPPEPSRRRHRSPIRDRNRRPRELSPRRRRRTPPLPRRRPRSRSPRPSRTRRNASRSRSPHSHVSNSRRDRSKKEQDKVDTEKVDTASIPDSIQTFLKIMIDDYKKTGNPLPPIFSELSGISDSKDNKDKAKRSSKDDSTRNNKRRRSRSSSRSKSASNKKKPERDRETDRSERDRTRKDRDRESSRKERSGEKDREKKDSPVTEKENNEDRPLSTSPQRSPTPPKTPPRIIDTFRSPRKEKKKKKDKEPKVKKAKKAKRKKSKESKEEDEEVDSVKPASSLVDDDGDKMTCVTAMSETEALHTEDVLQVHAEEPESLDLNPESSEEGECRTQDEEEAPVSQPDAKPRQSKEKEKKRSGERTTKKHSPRKSPHKHSRSRSPHRRREKLKEETRSSRHRAPSPFTRTRRSSSSSSGREDLRKKIRRASPLRVQSRIRHAASPSGRVIARSLSPPPPMFPPPDMFPPSPYPAFGPYPSKWDFSGSEAEEPEGVVTELLAPPPPNPYKEFEPPDSENDTAKKQTAEVSEKTPRKKRKSEDQDTKEKHKKKKEKKSKEERKVKKEKKQKKKKKLKSVI